ncbi:sigma-70 family RNA polymerase sigma factor [Streptomyces klenkii]|uniref:Sigma-70 family RNA polymerase sigma factor n=1 Tax=Streptomyces klenkii TaxID=1420899 RepID=A0A3B0BAS6_9ACTN|nr:sigma-70 family RNA polymerase sigma factor [Streptomyces klenkii]RKN69751.1 sigma-70 family RNA polymerase sigma factor [Streptomyces klenkii]
MNLDSTAGVVEAARSGDRAAQGELVAACLPLVYNIVGRALNGHADVDDVVQETMIRMVGGLRGLRDPEGFRSWLVAITMNQIRSHWRKELKDRKDAPAGGPQEVGEAAAPEPDFVEWSIIRLGLQGQRRQAAEATRWLDGDDQVVMSLWWLEAAGELSRAEVAAALGRSPQYTAVRVQRTKAQLETARVVVRALAAAPRCPELAAVLGGWDGAPGPLWRKRIARHARGCSDCGGHWSALVPAEGLLAGLGLVPLGAALLGRLTGGAMGDAMTACAAAGPGEGGPASASAPAAPSSHGDGARLARRAVVAGVVALVVAGALGGGPQLFSAAPESAAPKSSGGPVEIVPVTAGGPTPTVPERTDATPVGRSETDGRAPVRESAAPVPQAPAATPAPAPDKSPAAEKPPARTGAPSEPSRKPAAETSPRHTPPPAPGTDLAQEVVRIVNTERAKAGCGPVRRSAELAAFAQRRTEDTAQHTPLNQWSAFARGIAVPGHRWSAYGVNATTGHGSASAVVTAWMNDPGQRRTVLNCAYTEIGIGFTVTYDGPRWLQVFAAR